MNLNMATSLVGASAAVGCVSACGGAASAAGAAPRPADEVDTRLGTRGPGTVNGRDRPWSCGNTSVGPQIPHGSVNPGPETAKGGTDGYEPGMPVRGFGQLHVSGTGGGGNYGCLVLSPQVGLVYGFAERESPIADEIARPGYYAATLTRFGIRVEVTASRRVAWYRLTFPAAEDAHLVLDAGYSIPTDCKRCSKEGPLSGRIEVLADHSGIAAGGAWGGGWGVPQIAAHCAVRVSRPGDAAGTAVDGVASNAAVETGPGRRAAGWLRWRTAANETIAVKAGVSLRSVADARAFVAEEAPGWDFDAARAACEAAWNEALGAIAITGGEAAHRRQFYTALYHAHLMPHDRSGDNPHVAREDDRERFWDDHYCLWDTYRAKFPLMSLIRPEMVRDNVRSFIERHRRATPVAEAIIGGTEVDRQAGPGGVVYLGAMAGDNVDNVIADAFLKDVPGIDWAAAYAVQRFHAEYGRCDSYRKGDRGWVPEDRATNADGRRVRSPSSHSLEFSLNDHAAAVVARGLGRAAEAERWARRSRGWERLYRADLEQDGAHGFIAGRTADGLWTAGLFCEGSTWDYTFMLPHAVARLVELSGGPEAFSAKLLAGFERRRINMGNEPATLAARLFAWAGRPDLVAHWSRRTLSEEYGLEGYPGPDDGGAMSSWYVWTALGLFPAIGTDLYILNGPLFPRADVRLPGGRALTILGEGAGMSAPYVQSATWDGQPLTRCWLRHGEIAAGGTLVFVMGEQPSRWAADGPTPGQEH